jgi:radical SAM protein with 4Fe4S-binding SPASM domain
MVYCDLIMEMSDIKTSKHFCMMPWVHMHLLPSSSAVPCCVWPYDKPLGNVKEQTLKEIWNGPAYQELRQQMLQDKKIENCSQCHERDAALGHSLRQDANQLWSHLFDRVVKPTEDDGLLREYRMAYFDVRFSNICTFKCRGCSPELSSSWLGDHEKLYDYKSDRDKMISIMPNPRVWSELVEFLPGVEAAYFAGGEPLIMDEHYLILEELIRLGKSSIPLSYNSNMSNLRFRDKMVTDYWNKFESVTVGVSIDDFGERGEYFRHGMKWEKTVENIRYVQQKCPHVIFSVNCTVSLFNVAYLPELHQELIKLNLIKLGDFYANLLLDPVEYRMQNLPQEYRLKLHKKLTDYMDLIATKFESIDPHGVGRVLASFQSVINFMMSGDALATPEQFHARNDKLDAIRGENFRQTYPELSEALKSEKLT